MNIQFDDINLTSRMVHEHGLTPQELEASEPAALGALASFKKSSDDGLYGFPHLPFDKAVIKDVLAYAAGIRGSYDTVCLVGIGGSALGAWALSLVKKAFKGEEVKLR